ncbi:tyrosine-type recombinase/integrase [Microbacterium sp. SLBN-111]|uniref:tyrosine-type recombinase/integrase n=1 Tax=Microbacterium sp. SLBN-111 TaxID=3377733 RepID=UPI003C781D03
MSSRSAGACPSLDVKASDVEAWITQLGAGKALAEGLGGRKNGKLLSASSVLRDVGALAGILDDATRDGRIHSNPARGADNVPKTTGKAHRRYLTDAEVMRLATAIADPTSSTLVVLLAYTGIRWSEAVGLRVRDLNMPRRRLHVRRPSSRSTPLPRRRTEVLGAPHCRVPRVPRPRARGALHREGPRRHHLHRWRELHPPAAHVQVMVPHGLRTAEIERLTPHDLRHTAASLAVSAGANVKVLQGILGHKSAAMTLDTYADLFDDDLDNVASLLNTRANSAADVGNVWADPGIRAS